MGKEQQNVLKEQDKYMRVSKDRSTLKILVVCASREGVNNVLKKMKFGIPDGKGGLIHPQAVRCARKGYNYNSLAEYSVNNKALPFANRNIPEQHHCRFPTNKEKKMFGAECTGTASSSGSTTFTELGQMCDIIIIDEGGQLLEPEMMIPLVYAQRVPGPVRRMHVVQVADYRKLPPVSETEHHIRVNTKRQTFFRYSDQITSAFERLYEKRRAPLGMLNIQYRMHPVIADIHSDVFYSGKVKNGFPRQTFVSSYNDGQKAKYKPFPILDTSNAEGRFEFDQRDGKCVNDLEADMVEKVISHLITFDGLEAIAKNVAVIAPYRAQVEHIRSKFERGVLSDTRLRKHLDVLVVTVDAMQGGERDVVIFSATRSNEDRRSGFLSNWKRLNVAMSRVRKLIVMIGDANTLSKHDHFDRFISACGEGAKNPQGQLTLMAVAKLL